MGGAWQLGDYGEFIATEVYGLTQAPRRASGYDGVRADGEGNPSQDQLRRVPDRFQGGDLLLCLKIDLTGDWT